MSIQQQEIRRLSPSLEQKVDQQSFKSAKFQVGKAQGYLRGCVW